MHPKRNEKPNAKRPTVPTKDFDRLIAKAWKAKWWCVRAGNGYVKCYPPDGGKMIPVPCTPHGRGNRLKNLRQLFRKAGLDV